MLIKERPALAKCLMRWVLDVEGAAHSQEDGVYQCRSLAFSVIRGTEGARKGSNDVQMASKLWGVTLNSIPHRHHPPLPIDLPMSSKKTSKAKSKKEEALAFLDDLDNFTPPPSTAAVVSTNTITPGLPTSTTATPRASSSLDRPPSASVDAPRASTDSVRRPATSTVETEDPNEALAFLEAQIAQKRPIRSATPVNNKPAPSGPILPAPTAPTRPLAESARLPAANVPTSVTAPSGGGWGTSFWSSASAAVAKARTVADEGYKMVKEQAEKVQENAGVHGGEGERGIGGINLGRLGIAEGLGQLSQLGAGVVRGVDLEKLRE